MKKGRNMKKIFSTLTVLCVLAAAVFAQSDGQGDEYIDDYVYEQNGAGDQLLSINLGANFPLNFDGQLYPGASASIAYYRFLTNTIAVGGDLIIGYNVTVGKKALVTVPVTAGVIFQPYTGKFEFPLSAGIGFATTSCQGLTYFPSFAAKLSGGAYYRISEGWSAGLNAICYWIPEWFPSKPEQNDNGFFLSTVIGIRYHF